MLIILSIQLNLSNGFLKISKYISGLTKFVQIANLLHNYKN